MKDNKGNIWIFPNLGMIDDKAYQDRMRQFGKNLFQVLTEQRNDVVFCVKREDHDRLMDMLGVTDNQTRRMLRTYKIRVVR